MIFPDSENKISNQPPAEQSRGANNMNATIEAIIQMRMPKLSLNLLQKIEKSQKTYTCLYIFGDNLYVGTRNSKLYMYKIVNTTLEDQKFINPHCEVVFSVIADQRYFITIPECDDESQICIWETKKHNFMAAFKGHKSQISKAIFMRDTRYIATASWDNTARIWSLESLESDQNVKLYKGTYPILELEEINIDILAFGGDDCYLIFWNWKKEEVVHKVFGHAGSVTYIYYFSPFLLTCGGDNKFKIWEISYEQPQQKMQMVMEENQQKSVSDVEQKKISAKMLRADKEQYDSSVFCVPLNESDLYVIDRQGESFLCNPYKTHRLTNSFEYNENVTGIARVGNYFFISTTKGCIKVFQVKKKQEPRQENEG